MPDLDSSIVNSLRSYQKEAFEQTSAFIEERSHSTGESFLVCMPTGSGKSGVIACLAQRHVTAGDVLLLVPWDALATQLADDVSRKFWSHLGVSLQVAPLHRLLPSTARNQLETADTTTIWIATFATLQSMTAEARSLLVDRLRVVVVDEGHYEPAPAWGQTVRSLGSPVVIFTATPYRNDYKYFQIARDQTFRYRHVDAVADGFIRHLEIREFEATNAEEFVDSLVEFDRANLRSTDRVIVRCGTSEEIRQMTDLLLTRGQSALGVHERFTGKSSQPHFHKDVPSLATPAKYWIHQNKLIEGIDDPRFRCVAIYSAFANERSLVQQAGRVLRRDTESQAYLCAARGSDLSSSWSAFLEYDQSTELVRNPVEALIGVLAEVEYVDGAFRQPWGARGVVIDEVMLPKSIAVFESLDDSTDENIFHNITESIQQQLVEEDYFPLEKLLVSSERPNFGVRLYAIQGQSPLLRRTRFANVNLGAAAVYVRDGLIFFQATGRVFMNDLYPSVAGTRLKAVFTASSQTFSAVTLSNTDLGQDAERSRSVSARSIDLLAPDLGDYAKSPSALVGLAASLDKNAAPQDLSRYVGFNRARVRENGSLPIRAYLAWLDGLHAALTTARPSFPTLFDRFAETVQPESFIALNVLLDFDFAEYELNGMGLVIEDRCVDISLDGFELTFAGIADPIKCTLAWKRGKFEFQSSILDASRPTAADGRLLSDAINRDQAFRVLVKEDGPSKILIYVNSTFVAPRVQLSANSRSTGLMLDRLVVGSAEMDRVISEKGGTETPASGWDDGSLFATIDAVVSTGTFCGELVASAGDDLVVVCDDDARETADFYLINLTTKRLIVLHAKVASKATKVGASNLHEVTSQALKHLGTIRAGAAGFDGPLYRRRWNSAKPWRIGVRSVARIRSIHTPEQATAAVIEALRDPNYTREVWIAVGRGLSKAKLLGALGSPLRNPTATQALYLVQSAWATVASTGAKLRLFVGE